MKVGDLVKHTASNDVYGIITAVFPKATYPASQVQWFEWEIYHFLGSIQKNKFLEVVSTPNE